MSEELLHNPEETPPCHLELGDIIQVFSPDNDHHHEQVYYISYIDQRVMDLLEVNEGKTTSIAWDEQHQLKDESIQSIHLLSRSEEKGYAKQHNLVPSTWIDIHFGGDVPVIITGEITNLEEDMIEVTTFPAMEVIYIDFAYQGLPKELPIERIALREKPHSLEHIESLLHVRDEELDIESGLEPASDASMEQNEFGESVLQLPKDATPDTSLKEELHSLYSSANEIVQGRDLDDLVLEVEIPEQHKRHGIETQVNDMLDILLSQVPNRERTTKVMNEIHHLIQRFRELRTQYSHFDEHRNILDIKQNGADHKPLVHHLMNLDKKLTWILPVVALKKKLYVLDNKENVFDDVVLEDIAEDIVKSAKLQEDYQKTRMQSSNEEGLYVKYHKMSHDAPFTAPREDNYLATDVSIEAPMEALVHNLEKFHSTVIDHLEYARQRYVIQRFNLGNSSLEPVISKTGKKVFVRKAMNENDALTLHSLVMMPSFAMRASAIDLPCSTLLTKSHYAQHPLYYFRHFHRKRDVDHFQVTDLDKEMEKEFWDTSAHQIRHFSLDDTLDIRHGVYEKYLRSVLPNTQNVVRLFEKMYPKQQLQNVLSLFKAVQKLEPFLVYLDDVNYSQYNAIRYFVKNNRRALMEDIQNRRTDLIKYNAMQTTNPILHAMATMFREKKELGSVFMELYDLEKNTQGIEWLHTLYNLDHGNVFYKMVRLMMISLITPESLASALDNNPLEDMNAIEKIKATDCIRRVLTKKYSNLQDLQKDNGKVEVYYDSDYDKTPYSIMKEYQEQQNKLTPQDFDEFLQEVVVEKHDCPPKLAPEMAANLVRGKKRVEEGEYALLQMTPPPKKEGDVSSEEEELFSKMAYYKRVNDYWVHDDSVDDSVFVDNNDLFCNMSKICFKDKKSQVCESGEDAQSRMKKMTRKSLLDEFDQRFADSFETLEEGLRGELDSALRAVKRRKRLLEVQRYKTNQVAYNMGKYAKEAPILKSPHQEVLEDILGQDDFAQKQHDIIRFSDSFCRDPMVAELGEHPFMLYCVETNKPLLPKSLFQLAQAFVEEGSSYARKLDELCRKQGVIVDNTIFDKHSGRVLRHIDFVEEDGFDESGFKVVTNEVIVEEQSIAPGKSNHRLFEHPDSQVIYKLFRALVGHIGVKGDSIEDLVLRLSLEVISHRDVVKSETVYAAEAEAIMKQRNKKAPSYELYRNKMMILIVTGALLVGIQTSIPSFKVQKTFPGCVQSFRGYPLGGVEDKSGLRYLACVLNTLKTKSAKPWNSIKPLPLEVLEQQLQQIIEKTLLTRNDVTDLYAKKVEYNERRGGEDDELPLVLKSWEQFLPPLKLRRMEKNIAGLPSHFFQELEEAQKVGNKQQWGQIGMIKSKAMQFSFALMENVNDVIAKKGLLLKTASGVYYQENACCYDKHRNNSLAYFVAEHPELAVYVRMISTWDGVLRNVQRRSRASFFYDPRTSGLHFAQQEESVGHFESNIYLAWIHYAHLDNDLPIPEDIQTLLPEKPEGYPRNGSLRTKIDFLKQNGLSWKESNLHQLMDLIHRRNRVEKHKTKESQKGNRVSALKDLMMHVCDESDDDNVLCTKLKQLLMPVLEAYHPRKMIHEDGEDMYKLNNWLTHANTHLLERITQFLEQHAILSRREKQKLEEQLANIHMWVLEDSEEHRGTAMYSVTQFLRSSVFDMCKTLPERVANQHASNHSAHKHWGLAQEHNADIARFLVDGDKPFAVFQNDEELRSLLAHVQNALRGVPDFLHHLPQMLPIVREKVAYHALFSKRTLYMLYTYIWYSVLYEHIKATDEHEWVTTQIVEEEEGRENDDLIMNQAEGEDDVLLEVQIQAGNKKMMKQRVAEYVVALIQHNMGNKQSFDVNYDTIQKRITKSKLKEKKMITDFLKNMDDDERRVEDTKKMLKLGRWNVGLRKGLVDYDKGRYVEERNQLFEELAHGDSEPSEVVVQRDVEEVEALEKETQEEEYEAEATDLRSYYGDDADGAYYEEDRDDAFGYDD